MPNEITAAGLVIDYWSPPVNMAVWITIFIVVIVGLNLLPVQFYGETVSAGQPSSYSHLDANKLSGILVCFSESVHDAWPFDAQFHSILGWRTRSKWNLRISLLVRSNLSCLIQEMKS